MGVVGEEGLTVLMAMGSLGPDSAFATWLITGKIIMVRINLKSTRF